MTSHLVGVEDGVVGEVAHEEADGAHDRRRLGAREERAEHERERDDGEREGEEPEEDERLRSIEKVRNQREREKERVRKPEEDKRLRSRCRYVARDGRKGCFSSDW